MIGAAFTEDQRSVPDSTNAYQQHPFDWFFFIFFYFLILLLLACWPLQVRLPFSGLNTTTILPHGELRF